MRQAETVTLFSHDGSLTVPDCEAAPDGVFKNQGNPQPDAYHTLTICVTGQSIVTKSKAVSPNLPQTPDSVVSEMSW